MMLFNWLWLGKTRTAVMAIFRLLKVRPDAKILIVVPTEVLQKQWMNDYIIKYNLIKNCEVKIINTVIKTSWDVDLLICDECHMYVSDTFQEVFNCVDYDMILCLTATLERLDGKEVLIKSFAPVCDIVTVQDSQQNGWLSPYKEYVVLLDVDLSDYNKWNQEFIGFFSQLNFQFDQAMLLTTNIIERRKYAKKMGIDQKQMDAICYGWMDRLRKRKKFVQSHPHKFEIARKILDARKDRKCITFCSTIKDAEQLSIKGEFVLHSKQSKKSNDEALKQFNEVKSGVLHSSKAVNQGVDVKGLSVEIIMNTDSSKITKTQKLGRALRVESGKQAEIFTLIIKGTVEEKWLANSMSSSYIIINEQQLDKVLNYEPLEVRQRNLVKDIKNRF